MPTPETVVIESPCSHVAEATIRAVERPAKGCTDCLKIGGQWARLRICLTCGHVACCDSSPNQHATKHFRASRHPIMTSAESGETWVWCYVDERPLGS